VCAGVDRGVRRFLIDWLPVLVVAAGYDTVRAQAPDLLTRAIVRPQLRFDEVVFGGTAPTVRLQRLLGVHPGRVHPWDYAVAVCYLSHFVTTLVVAGYLYATDRARFRRAATLIVTVSVAGFATYFILPAVPPWLASRYGDLPHTTRVVHDVWGQLGLPGVAKVFNGDANFANPVAALPSLHAAWPLMLLLIFWPTARRGRWVLLAYNVAMCFVLVYGAEHYVSDLLLGWTYTIVVFVAWSWFWNRQQQQEQHGATLAMGGP
jgi:membrane-associated phospholipid phosphatase